MLKIKRVVFLIILVVSQNIIHADILESGTLKNNLENNKACFIYQPYLGVVNDIDNLDIKSEKFEITDKKVLILNGDIQIDFPNGILQSEKARVDQENGIVEFKKGGSLFLENYFFKSKEGSFNKDQLSIMLLEGDAFLNDRGLILSFSELNGNLESQLRLNQVSMTSCSDVKNGWELLAKSIVLNDQTKRGYAKQVKVKAFDKTILRLPYLPFATSDERMSGFLEPSVSFSSDGLDFMLPYYQVISNKSDITIAARNINERGFGLEGNFRKIHGKINNLRNIDFIYFDNDKEYGKLYPENSNSRWAFGLKDSYNNQKKFKVNIDWAKASDSLVLRDISNEIIAIGNQRVQNLKQNVSLQGKIGDIGLKLSQEGYQTLNPILTNGYKKSPSFDIFYFKKFKNFSINERFNYTDFKTSSLHGFYGNSINNRFPSRIKNPIEGSRIFYDLEISNESFINGYMLSTSVGFKSLNFDISNSNAKTNSVNVPTFKFDINSLFIKSIGTSLHILKPRFFYGYVGYEDQNTNPVFDTHNITMMNQLFNIDRFAGMDRIGDQNFYTLSLEYRKRELNMEKISFKISQKFYLEDKKIFLNDMNMLSMNMDIYLADDLMAINSMTHNMINDEDPIMLMGKWMPNKNIMIMTYGSYSKDDKKFPMAGITLNQKFKFGKVGYAKRYKKVAGDFEKTLDYSELSADLNFKDNFSLIAKLKRDDDTNSKIESVFGIGYENCCFVFRVTASDKNLSKYLDSFNDNSFTYLDEAWDNIIRIENKSRINFEFEFKGLNSSYEKINKFMNNSILNY